MIFSGHAAASEGGHVSLAALKSRRTCGGKESLLRVFEALQRASQEDWRLSHVLQLKYIHTINRSG